MKGLIIASLLFTGGSGAAAISDEGIREEFIERYQHIREDIRQFRNDFRNERRDQRAAYFQEEGFKISEDNAWLNTLTEDQKFTLLSEIDIINATYDFQNMTIEEINDAMLEIRLSLLDLLISIEVENPLPILDMTDLTVEQIESLQAKRAELYANYNFDELDEDEKIAAFREINQAMRQYYRDLGLGFDCENVIPRQRGKRFRGRNRRHRGFNQDFMPEVTQPDTTEEVVGNDSI